jgi:hypothetical protein
LGYQALLGIFIVCLFVSMSLYLCISPLSLQNPS